MVHRVATLAGHLQVNAPTVFRSILKGDRVVVPASVFDPITARMATNAGSECLQLAGSVAAHVILGAPDLMLLTLTELCALVRRITRAVPNTPLFVDADAGFGNVLNVYRAREELQHAGCAALSLEDSDLPGAFGAQTDPLGGSAGAFGVIGIDEMAHRLKLLHDQPSNVVVVARTSAYKLPNEGLQGVIRRATEYQPYCEALHVIGPLTEDDLRQIHRAVPALPLILSNSKLDSAILQACNVKLNIQGHRPFLAAMRAAERALTSADPVDTISQESLSAAVESTQWSDMQRNYLKVKKPHQGLK